MEKSQLEEDMETSKYDPSLCIEPRKWVYVDEFMAKPVVKFKKLHPKAVIPKYQTEGAAGMDLTAVIIDEQGFESFIQIVPGLNPKLVGTGLAVELPHNTEGQIRPRSGLAAKFGITVANSPGTVDEDYRGEIKVALVAIGHETVNIKHGDRIAQLVIAPVVKCSVVETEELSDTTRGAGGFGSTKGF